MEIIHYETNMKNPLTGLIKAVEFHLKTIYGVHYIEAVENVRVLNCSKNNEIYSTVLIKILGHHYCLIALLSSTEPAANACSESESVEHWVGATSHSEVVKNGDNFNNGFLNFVSFKTLHSLSEEEFFNISNISTMVELTNETTVADLPFCDEEECAAA